MAMSKNAGAAQSDVGYVYVATTNTYIRNGIYKVGMTDDIFRRLKDLSSTSGVAEPFFDVLFFRTPSLGDAKRLESEIHKRLDSISARLQPNREFFRTGTCVGLALCIRKCARDLGIELIENTTCNIGSIIESDDAPVTLRENLNLLPNELKKLYFRGARDFVRLMLMWRSIEKDHPIPSFFHDISLELRDDDLNHKCSLSLFAIIRQKIAFHYGRNEAIKFEEQFRICMDEWLEDRFAGNDLEMWKELINTSPNWPERTNNSG